MIEHLYSRDVLFNAISGIPLVRRLGLSLHVKAYFLRGPQYQGATHPFLRECICIQRPDTRV